MSNTKFVSILVLAVLVLDTLSNVSAAPFAEKAKKTVVFIFTTDKDNKPVALGTGFLVGVKVGENQFAPYLVTALHVIKNEAVIATNSLNIRVNTRDGGSEYLRLPLAIDNINALFTHPTENADLAVIPVALDINRFDYLVIQDDIILTRESFASMKITEGDEVFFIGLFTSFYGSGRNYPILRSGKVALLTEEKIPWPTPVVNTTMPLNLYLLETTSFGGNSGSPVFVKANDISTGLPVLRLIGIMKGTYEHNSPLSAVNNNTIIVSKQNTGIAAVIPSYLLHDILFSEVLTKQRKTALSGQAPPQPAASSK